MELFKLKNEAKPFFENNLKSLIKPLPFWIKNLVSENALQVVDKVYLTYGIPTSKSCTDKASWNLKENTSQLHFTINCSDTNNHQYNVLKDDDSINDLMCKIQEVVTSHIYDRLPF